ncbi:histidinol-phosphate transaminase [Motiliproteus sp.]|uniref:histidinol-phosphate transaminase n=1 Tax=Motiliproteus sp. TaxID=1898955 RepID=UPI003BAC7A5E
MTQASLEQRISKLIRPEVRALHAYQVPPSTGMLKLDAMENPYQWSDATKQAWLDKLAEVEINRYPEPQAQGVKDRLRQVMGIPSEYELMLGNGSDEIIQILAMAVAGDDVCVMAPEPSFVMYQMIATFCRIDYVGVPLDSQFDLDLGAMLEQIEARQPALIFLAQPNNPTGNLYSEEKIRRIAEASQGLVIVDEAYTAFTDCDSLSLLGDYDNLVLMRTLSKVGLAGLRLGLLIGKPEWLGEFDKLRLPYNINVLTQASAEFALDHYELFREQTAKLRQARISLIDALQQLPQLQVWPSEANFVLVRSLEKPAAELHEALKGAGVLVKKLDGGHPALAGCLRINVSTPEENQRLIEALKPLL